MAVSCWVVMLVCSQVEQMRFPALGKSTVQSLLSGERPGSGNNLNLL